MGVDGDDEENLRVKTTVRCSLKYFKFTYLQALISIPLKLIFKYSPRTG